MKQRRFLLSILMLMLCMVYAVAEPVTKDQALQKAKTFLAKKGLAAKTSLNLAYQGRQRGQQKGAPVKNASYYVFNNGYEGGFVIIAGDDCAEDVLGYADNGSFDAENIPSNMQAFLEGYAEEIDAARARGAKAPEGDATVEKTRKVVAPLIETHWSQREPFNQLCYTPGGVQCVTGCVATALAQVMYYYKWPQGATTAIPEYNSRYGDAFSELPSTTFDWDKMKKVYLYSGEDDEASEQAVAKLMWYCGHAVKMNYAQYSSGASEYYIPGALKNYFGYPGNPTWVYRSSYTTEEWDELIYKELKYGRPVLYGASTSGGSGHEFICDGYDGHGLYHINWGWGGLSDGYFRLQALRPSSQGVGGSNDYGGYSLGHDAIIGVCNTEINNEESDPPSSVLRTTDFSVSGDATMEYDAALGFNGANLYFEYALSGSQTGIDWGFGLYKDGELLQMLIKGTNVQLETGYYYTLTGQILSGMGTNLEDGEYQLIGINRLNGTEEWFPNIGSVYISVEISNGSVTFTKKTISKILKVEVTNVEQRFDLKDVSQIRAYVRNTGNADYSGELYLMINGSNMAREGVYLPIDGEDYVDFFFPATTGSVDVLIVDSRNNVLYERDGFVLGEYDAPASSLTLVNENIKNFNSNQTEMYGSLLDCTVTLKNTATTDYEGNLNLKVWKMDEEGWFSTFSQEIPISIKAGEEKVIPVTYSSLAVGDNVSFTLFDPAGNTLTEIDGFAKIVPGVVYWKGDGSRYAVAAPESGISLGKDVAAFSLEDFGDSFNFDVGCSNLYAICYVTANCIASPVTNMVRGGKASSITLDGNKDFFVPKRFFASDISYSREVTLGADGRKGWQSITLPFAVEKVYSEKLGRNADWYHGNDTEEKDFWVREFKQVKGTTVQFANAEVWVPNVPYIFAVPGNKWGNQYDMRGTIDFGADDVWVEKSNVSAVVSDSYEFVGLYGGLATPTVEAEMFEYNNLKSKMENAYILNETGSAFVLGSADLAEKHNLCYFTMNDRTITPPSQLNIGTFDETDGICMPQVTVTDGQQVDVFTIDGVKVANVNVIGGKADLNQLPKGIYVVGGKKIVR